PATTSMIRTTMCQDDSRMSGQVRVDVVRALALIRFHVLPVRRVWRQIELGRETVAEAGHPEPVVDVTGECAAVFGHLEALLSMDPYDLVHALAYAGHLGPEVVGIRHVSLG